MAYKTLAPVTANGTRAVLFDGADAGYSAGYRGIAVNVGAATVYVGDNTVTAANGIPVEAGASYDDTMDPGEQLYVITSGTSVEVRRMVGSV